MGKRIEVERFSSCAREIGCGDCEDLAKEMLMLFRDIKRQTWKTAEMRAAQTCLSMYVATLAIGAVTARRLQRYTTANKGLPYEAHAFCVLFPASHIQHGLQAGCDQRNGGNLQVTGGDLDRAGEWDRLGALPLMVLDGTNIKEPEEDGQVVTDWPTAVDHDGLHLLESHIHSRQDQAVLERAKTIMPCKRGSGSPYYIYVISAFTFDVVDRGTADSSVFELFFYYHNTNVYGVRFEDLCSRDKGIAVYGSFVATDVDDAHRAESVARRAVVKQMPIGPHSPPLPEEQDRVNGDVNSICLALKRHANVRDVAQARPIGKKRLVTYILSGHDMHDDNFHTEFAKTLGSSMESQDLEDWSAHVYAECIAHRHSGIVIAMSRD